MIYIINSKNLTKYFSSKGAHEHIFSSMQEILSSHCTLEQNNIALTLIYKIVLLNENINIFLKPLEPY